jgi:hypothetical protein
VCNRREVRKHLRKLFSLLEQREMPEFCSICLDPLDLDAQPYRPFEVRPEGACHCSPPTRVAITQWIRTAACRC